MKVFELMKLRGKKKKDQLYKPMQSSAGNINDKVSSLRSHMLTVKSHLKVFIIIQVFAVPYRPKK